MMPTRRIFGLFPSSTRALAPTSAPPGLMLGLMLALWPQIGNAVPTLPGDLVNPMDESQSCQLCHTFGNAMGAEGEPLYAPYYGWQGSLMANAARDPVFWAGVALADQDHPGETVDCVRCHSPRAFLEGRGDATSIDQLIPADFEGVGCEVCHRMSPEGELGNARYAIDDVLAADGAVPRRGPWDYRGMEGDPGNPPHSWLADPFVASSQMCGTCHDVTTDRERVDDAGMPMGVGFNEQRTYSEWQGSAYAQPGPDFLTCQDCHMPAVTDVPGCNQFVDMYSHPTGGRRHDLVGANRFMVEVLRAEYGNAGTGDVNDFFFNETIDRMDELLATAATLELAGPDEVRMGEGLMGLSATVTNNTGHKLPSGYSEGRVMWLEVMASYDGNVVWSSGQYIEGMGPQDGPQLRTYEGVAEEYSSGQQLHLLLNDHWVEDTRIPPLGLVPNLETDPVGSRYELLGDGTWPNYDVAEYSFPGAPELEDATPADAGDDVLDVSVRLLYLINTPEYVQLLADDNVSNDAGNHVAMLFDTMGGAPPLVLAEQQLQIPIVEFGEVSGTTSVNDTGTPDSSGGDSGTQPPVDGTADTAATATATAMGSGTQTDGPGADGGDDGGEGCGCRTGGDGSRWSWIFGLPVLLVMRRRRSSPARDRAPGELPRFLRSLIS